MFPYLNDLGLVAAEFGTIHCFQLVLIVSSLVWILPKEVYWQCLLIAYQDGRRLLGFYGPPVHIEAIELILIYFLNLFYVADSKHGEAASR